jgi:hypothetical protein
MATTLVNVRTFPLVNARRVLPEGVIYIGRASPRVGLKASPWANPYRLSNPMLFADRPEWLRRALLLGEYDRWMQAEISMGALDPEELRGHVLACWCPPLSCHGGVILDWMEAHPLVPVLGARIEFGLHRQPEKAAETAEAWPSRQAFRRSFDERHRRQMRRVAR